jgi:hypothetical protein
MKYSRLAAVCLVCALFVTGCGSNMLKVKGRVVKAGQPFIIAPDESMRIVFVPSEPLSPDKYDSFFAIYSREDGSFRVTGKDGNGLPPGKYKVGLELLKHKNDEFKGAFSAKRSPFAFEVKSSSDEIVLDLAQIKG